MNASNFLLATLISFLGKGGSRLESPFSILGYLIHYNTSKEMYLCYLLQLLQHIICSG